MHHPWACSPAAALISTDGLIGFVLKQVANKVAEIVMLLDGREVCCQSDRTDAEA